MHISTNGYNSAISFNLSKTNNVLGQQPQNNNLNLFKAEFDSYFQQSMGQRVSTQPERSNRRLDSLARLLEQNLTCVAVKYDHEKSQILISSNKIYATSRSKNKSIDSIELVMKFLADHEATTEEVIIQLTNIIYDNFSQEKRISSINKEPLKILITELLKDLYCSGKTTKAWQDAKKINPRTSTLDETLINKISIMARDFIKLRQDLIEEFGCNQNERNNSFGALNEKKYHIVRSGKKDEHAEMRLANKENEYIGISKLCCAHCGLAVKIIGVNTRGKHGQVFKWGVPDFILKTPNNLKRFIGERAYEIYENNYEIRDQIMEHVQSDKLAPKSKKNRDMSADLSDSDVELGLSCNEEEYEKIQPIKFNDNMKLIESKESLRLLKHYGIPKMTMIEMRSISPDKFYAFTNKNVLKLLENYKLENRLHCFSLSFEDLSLIYDKNGEFFNAIISFDNKHGIFRKLLWWHDGFENILEAYKESPEKFRQTVSEDSLQLLEKVDEYYTEKKDKPISKLSHSTILFFDDLSPIYDKNKEFFNALIDDKDGIVKKFFEFFDQLDWNIDETLALIDSYGFKNLQKLGIDLYKIFDFYLYFYDLTGFNVFATDKMGLIKKFGLDTYCNEVPFYCGYCSYDEYKSINFEKEYATVFFSLNSR